MTSAHARRLAAEFIGTAALLLAVVGSGIVATASQQTIDDLLLHALAVGATLGVVIAVFWRISGAHFNPIVTMVATLSGGLAPRLGVGYIAAQTAGSLLGVLLANLIFDHPPLALASIDRGGLRLAGSELLASLGLIVTVFGTARTRPSLLPLTVGVYVAAAILFTPSAAFANPAATFARVWTDTATGISPAAAVQFVAAQVLGAATATALVRYLFPTQSREAMRIGADQDHTKGAETI